MTGNDVAADWVRAFGVSRVVESVSGPGAWVLRECSVDLPAGSLTAIVGPSGAGKTSLMYCLSGLDRPSGGTVVIDGVDVYTLSRQKRAEFLRTRVGFVFQQYNLIPYLTVAENVALPGSLAGRRTDRDRLTGLLDRFGLREKQRMPASALSGGEQQRVALCRALLLRPVVVFADEPTGALDTANSQIVLDALREMAGQGRTVVMVTHDVDAASTADRVVFMRDGSITGTGEGLSPDGVLAGMRRSARTTAETGAERC